MPEFIYLALAAGCGVALVAGPLGCFAVWRRMAYFGDTLAHSALTGIAFGLLLSVNISLAVTLVCLLLALLLVVLQNIRTIANDTLLGILAHSMLALGLVAISVSGNLNTNLYGYLFGDLLAVTRTDVITIYLTAGFILPLLIGFWRPLLAITVNEDLAQVDGIRVGLARTVMMLLMALVIAVTMKVVGVLLITALLILPAASGRRWSKTPEQMALAAALIGMLAIVGGLAASWWFDTPAGPSAVLTASVIFLLSLLKKPAI